MNINNPLNVPQQTPSFPSLITLTEQQQLSDQASHSFCYFDIRNEQTLITESVLLFLSGLICVMAIKKYYLIWKMMSNANKNATFAYLGIMVWWFSYIAKDLYGIIIYIVYTQRTNVTSELSWFSKFYFALDWGNAFILQTVLIFVPYHWMKQISEALSAVSGSDSESGLQENLTTIHYKGIQSKLFPLIKKYLILRSLSVVPVGLFLAITDFYTVSLISKILLCILLLDCTIIIIILSLGIHSIRTNELLRMQLDQDEAKRLFNQYLIIIICTGLRFAYCLFVFIYGAAEKLTQDDCSLTSQTEWQALVLIVLITIFAHYLPILIILRIYTVEEKPHDITKSLIID